MKKLMILAVLLALTLTGACAEEEKLPFCSGYWTYYEQEDGTALISHYGGHDTKLRIPAMIDHSVVSGMAHGAFESCDMLEEVVIPDGVVNVEGNPFAGCTKLKTITVSQEHPTLALIDGVLFEKPEKRLVCFPAAMEGETYQIPQGIRVIGEGAFSHSRLTGILIPDSVTTIGNGAFHNCVNLSEIAIPDSVVHMGVNPFFGCLGQLNLTVSPEHPVLELRDNMLLQKTEKWLVSYLFSDEVETCVIPEDVQVIGRDAFHGCRNLTGIVIPEGVTTIGFDAFRDCTGLTEISIPDSVTAIGDGAFARCEYLTKATLPKDLTKVGELVFYCCYALEKVTLPDGVTSIGEFAFYGCESLKEINFPGGLTSIADFAFEDCDGMTCTIERESYALQWCRENGVEYVYSDALDWLYN